MIGTVLEKPAVSDQLRQKVREELPEIGLIADQELASGVIEAWALALAWSSFDALENIEPGDEPGHIALLYGSEVDHIRGVARLALALAGTLQEQLPELEFERDLLIAGALCQDVGKPFELDSENRERWEAEAQSTGRPAIPYSAFGLHICLTVGLPEEVAHCTIQPSAGREPLRRSLESTIVRSADQAFWAIAEAGGLVDPASGRKHAKPSGAGG